MKQQNNLSAFVASAHIIKKMHADDMGLLREFAATGSDAIFAVLVQRHINLVYSAALRRLGNEQEAEEVAQVVFIILAKKAATLRPGTILSGWLYQTAQLTAANLRRATLRRQQREQEAFMQFTEQSGPDFSHHRFGPLLEEAMERLNGKERDALVLRFFENRTVGEVAAALGLREDAAQKRVNRATDKLRNYFVRRGVQVSTAALLASIGSQAVQAAPVNLAAKITVTAVAAKGATASTTTLTLIKGALKIMAWTKAKTAIVTGAVILFAATSTTIIIKESQAHKHHAANKSSAVLSPIMISVTAEMKADGSIHGQGVVVETNATTQVIRTESLGNEEGDITRITDVSGRPMKFERKGSGYLITLNRPVPPGGQVSYSIEEDLTAKQLEATGMIKTTAPGIYEINLTSYPGNDRDLQYVWVLRLPPGATLLEKERALTTSTNAGQIELRLDKMIPPNGSYTIGCRYRLATNSP